MAFLFQKYWGRWVSSQIPGWKDTHVRLLAEKRARGAGLCENRAAFVHHVEPEDVWQALMPVLGKGGGGVLDGKQCLLTAYKAKSRVLEFVTPKTKKEAQKLTGLLGFWRHHMPLLSAILKPLNSVTRKKYGFSWGPEQTAAFEAAKMPVQTALDLRPVQKGPVELQVSLDDDCKCWS